MPKKERLPETDAIGNKSARLFQITIGSFRVVHPFTLPQVSLDIVGALEKMTAKTYGTVSPELQKAMSGLEFVSGLVTGALPLNTFAKTLGYDVVAAESGRVAITLNPTGAHLNPWGTVHGGLTATLLDSCMGLAIQSMLDKGTGSTTLEFKVSLVRAITLETGRIRAEGKVLNCGRRVSTAEGRVTDAKGRLLAHGTTTCLIIPS